MLLLTLNVIYVLLAIGMIVMNRNALVKRLSRRSG